MKEENSKVRTRKEDVVANKGDSGNPEGNEGATRASGLDLATRARALASELARDLASELARDLASELATDVRALASELARASELATDVRDLASTDDHDFAGDLASILASDLASILARDLITRSPLSEVTQNSARTQLYLDDVHRYEYGFSTEYLKTTVIPYIDAIIQIQHVLDEASGQPVSDISILGIQYGSVTVDITGGIRDTLQLILENVVPWRRRTERERAELSVRKEEIELKQKEIETDQLKAALEIDDKRADLELKQGQAEAEKARAEAQLLQTQAEAQALGNQKMRLEIIKLTFDMLSQRAPNLSEEERMMFAMKMIDPVELVATSPLELTGFEEISSPDSDDEQSSDDGE